MSAENPTAGKAGSRTEPRAPHNSQENGVRNEGPRSGQREGVQGGRAEEVPESDHVATTLKEFLTSESATKLAEIATAYMLKAKEIDAAARERAAASYHRSMVRWNYTFLASLGVCLGVILIVIWMLRDSKDLLLPVLSSIISLIAGAGGGFVFGRRPSRPSD